MSDAQDGSEPRVLHVVGSEPRDVLRICQGLLNGQSHWYQRVYSKSELLTLPLKHVRSIERMRLVLRILVSGWYKDGFDVRKSLIARSHRIP
jgi:hypothetical protein